MMTKTLASAAFLAVFGTCPALAQNDAQKAALASIDPLFESFMAENNVPGVVYGVVADGKLIYVRALGVQDTVSKAPVTADSVFRIASMSKNFTALAALKLRDEGKLAFDTPAERYIPELGKLKYPTTDSPRILVRDLLSHSAGFVTDDPWGDRQLAMSESDFSQLVAAGVPFSRAPGMAYEYSNFGYALVGRLVTNVSGRNYADYIREAFFRPLGMNATTFDFASVPASRRAIGYRFEGGKWLEEPVLGPGAFGAMGGLLTSANDYARYVAWELAAWPPRDGAEDGILKRSSIRELARPQTFAITQPPAEPGGCARSLSYSLGMIPFSDCVLGFHLGHSGGLPGYGSNLILLPERGIGVFAFANRTYAPASRVTRVATEKLVKSEAFPVRAAAVSPGVQAMADVARRVYAAGNVLVDPKALAMNVLLDRSAELRNADLAALKSKLGACQNILSVRPANGMNAVVTFQCERGTLRAGVLLAPTTPPSLQRLEFAE
jgi:serine-type D-Ala-D-Ala carboxypeptidase/endopeptidase